MNSSSFNQTLVFNYELFKNFKLGVGVNYNYSFVDYRINECGKEKSNRSIESYLQYVLSSSYELNNLLFEVKFDFNNSLDRSDIYDKRNVSTYFDSFQSLEFSISYMFGLNIRNK